MQITYLVGNGFDINLGLKTKFSDFIEQYIRPDIADADSIKEFKEFIEKCNRGLIDIDWCDAETAFGKYTVEFKNKQDGYLDFAERHDNFCNSLSNYLSKESSRFSIERIQSDGDLLKDVAKALIHVQDDLKPEEADSINSQISNASGGYDLNFINFNYTDCLDQIVKYIAKARVLEQRLYRSAYQQTRLFDVVHVHGTVAHGMVLGVNDDSQIESDIFSAEAPEYRNQIIKPFCNKAIGEKTEEKVTNIIQSSDLIIITGMSLGETDARWWDAIIKTLLMRPHAVLIIYNYSTPPVGLLPTKHDRSVREVKKRFFSYASDVDKEKISVIQNRVFVTGNNLFSSLKDVVNK